MSVTAAEGLDIVIEKGTRADYRELAHLHYAPGDPAVIAGVWRAVCRADFRFLILDLRLGKQKPHCVSFNRKLQIANRKSRDRLIAVGVLAYPTPSLAAREAALGLAGPRYGEKLRWVNTNVRTIARVIVHPQFRAMGIASELVRRICCECPTRYVEALAVMGDVVPFFERAGMRRVCDGYFLWERGEDDKVTR